MIRIIPVFEQFTIFVYSFISPVAGEELVFQFY